MKRIPLNEVLLSIIFLVQKRKELALIESKLCITDSWHSDIREYYQSLSSLFLYNQKLSKKEECFQALLNFEITDEIRNSDPSKLEQFIFEY